VERFVEIVGVAMRFLDAAGVPRWALMAAAVLLAVAYILLPVGIRWIFSHIKIEPVALDPERDPSLPDAIATDSNGTVIDPTVSGRPTEGESGSGG